ncbi:MAG: hypothetical protein IPL40_04595 [Proteobacteria bacterium]|nr:hypothetical protein [Pseudomonadota bacterium]
MSASFHEYLELFDYFGRGGMVRLNRGEFEARTAELEGLLRQQEPFSDEQLARLVALRAALFHERPKLEQLVRGR